MKKNFHLVDQIKVTFAKINNYGSVLWRALSLLWRTAPRETNIIIITLVLQKIVPAVSVWITKQIVDTIVATQTQNQELSIWTLGGFITIWVGVILLSQG